MSGAMRCALVTLMMWASSGVASQATVSENELRYLEHDYLFVTNAPLYAAVQSVIDTLLAKRADVRARPKLLIYSADKFSAAADTEGNIVISTQTLRRLDSEDELAALLAHELAHVIKRHPASKTFMQNFPVGVDTYSAMIAATDRIETSRGKADKADKELDKKRVSHSQNVSLFWSDIMAPSWNRGDEAEADRMGLEMMQAAGYDPRAVATLITKLSEARVQRSERMQALCEELIAEEQRKRRITTSSDDEETRIFIEHVDRLRGRGTERLIREGFDKLLSLSTPYSSNDERIEQINRLSAPESSSQDMVATKKLKYRKSAKDNGELLNMDALAISGMSLLGSQDTASGIDALRQVVASKVDSPHFNLAASSYHQEMKDAAKSDAALVQWLADPRAPAVAFLRHADNQIERGALTEALATLDQGRARLGTGVPFLPTMITTAKANQDEALAEQLTIECKTAEESSWLTRGVKIFTGNKPTGVYAECVARLGRLPAGEKTSKGVLSLFDRSESDAGK